MATITVSRNKGWFGRSRRASIMADNIEIGSVKAGESLTVRIPDGASGLYVKIDWGRSEPYPVNQIREGDTIYVKARFSWNLLRNLGILPIPVTLESKARGSHPDL